MTQYVQIHPRIRERVDALREASALGDARVSRSRLLVAAIEIGLAEMERQKAA